MSEQHRCDNPLCGFRPGGDERKASARPAGMIKIAGVWAHALGDQCWNCGVHKAVAAIIFSTTVSPCVYGYCEGCGGSQWPYRVRTPEELEAARSLFALWTMEDAA